MNSYEILKKEVIQIIETIEAADDYSRRRGLVLSKSLSDFSYKIKELLIEAISKSEGAK